MSIRLQDLHRFVLSGDETKPVSLLVGGPGAGKTSALKEWKKEASLDLIYTATTNAAAQALGGRTIHSFLGLPFNSLEDDRELVLQKISSSLLSYFMSNTRGLLAPLSPLVKEGPLLVLVIDEAFILDAYTLQLIKEGVELTNNRLATQNLGRVLLVLCGDPAQLLAIGGQRFYKALFLQEDIPIFRLEGVYRQANAPLSDLWVEAVSLYRTKGNPLYILEWIKELYKRGTHILRSSLDFTPREDSFTIAFTNQMVLGINLQMLINHCHTKQLDLHLMYKDGVSGNLASSSLYLAEGAPIIITSGDKERGLTKRQRGKVLRVEKASNNHQRVITRIEDKEISFLHEKGVADLPLVLGWAGTIHMSQGSTYRNIQVLMSEHILRTPGAALVGLTRHVENLSLVGMKLSDIEHILSNGVDKEALQYV